MTFQGIQILVRSKIIIEEKTLERVYHFNYLSCDTLLEDKNVEIKIHKYQAICGIINRPLKYETNKETRMKFYKTMAVAVLTYGNDSWITKAKNIQKHTSNGNEIP